MIATTPSMIEYTEKRFNINIPKFSIKPACVDLKKFDYNEIDYKEIRSKLNLNNKIVCIYAGKFGEFYLKDEVFEFFKSAFTYWGNRFHVLLLSDLQEEELITLCNKYLLERNNFTLRMVLHEEVPRSFFC